MQHILLENKHIALGAKMVPFAGFYMPVRYSSDIEEHMAVRHGVGIFDVSHMGEFIIRGEDALAFLQQTTSNDVSKLYVGKAQYAYIPNEDGGIVDDIIIYQIGENEYYLVVNASNIDKDWEWLRKKNTINAEMINVSANTSLFAVQGPKAVKALQSLTQIELASMPYYTFDIATIANIPNVMISATGYTGAGGFELFVANKDAEKLWDAILQAGQAHGIKPIGLGARDTLRLEKGYCLYGNDIDDHTSPIAAGLGWVTKFNKIFTNCDALKEQKEKGVHTTLVGFKMIDKGIPRSHYEIKDSSGESIGHVTSGSQSPVLNMGIGLGYIKKSFAQPGSTIFISVRDKNLKAEVVNLPFV